MATPEEIEDVETHIVTTEQVLEEHARYPKKVRATVTPCGRCGETHTDMVFTKFDRIARISGLPLVIRLWASCPTNGEPILVLGVAGNPEIPPAFEVLEP